MNHDIIVIGSLNMDMVVSVDQRPNVGETVLGKKFFVSPGGKGANQAYAAGLLGGSVQMIGALGTDIFAEQLRTNLEKVNVDVSQFIYTNEEPTGVAVISIDSEGDNSIIVAPGANQKITISDIQAREEWIKKAKILVVQLEIPIDAVMEAVKIAHQYGVLVLLDPAPAQKLPDDLLQMIDYITPNETEIFILTGIEVNDPISAKAAADQLIQKGVKNVIAKLGSKGVTLVNQNDTFSLGGYHVKVVDSTAAGDAFAGAFATAITEGKDLKSAVQFANAVGALSVTKLGAQQSIPNRAEADLFLQTHTENA